jgi:hypothetical protein
LHGACFYHSFLLYIRIREVPLKVYFTIFNACRAINFRTFHLKSILYNTYLCFKWVLGDVNKLQHHFSLIYHIGRTYISVVCIIWCCVQTINICILSLVSYGCISMSWKSNVYIKGITLLLWKWPKSGW